MNQTVRICSFVLFNFFILIFIPGFSQEKGVSQETIKIAFEKEGNQLGDVESKNLKLKHGNNYRLQIENVNSAHIKAVVNPKSFNLQSNISEPLKVLFPGISTNKEADTEFDSLTLIQTTEMAFSFLEDLDSLSKVVYEMTKFAPSVEKVKMIVGDNLPIKKEGATLKKTEESISLITFLSEKYSIWFDKKLENGDLNEEGFKLGYEIKSMKEVIDKQGFIGKATFIEKSMKANPVVKTSGFKAVKDGVDLEVLIIDTYLKDTLYKGEIEFVNYQMWSFDFSTGFLFNRLIDTPYYFGPTSEGKKEVLAEDYSKWDIAIGGMAHLTYKLSGFVSFGPQIGIGVSILDAKPKYAVGAGFLLGRKGKVALNGGVAFGKVKVLSNTVEETNGRNYVPESITTVPTFDRFDYSGYFGISYNLTKKSY